MSQPKFPPHPSLETDVQDSNHRATIGIITVVDIRNKEFYFYCSQFAAIPAFDKCMSDQQFTTSYFTPIVSLDQWKLLNPTIELSPGVVDCASFSDPAPHTPARAPAIPSPGATPQVRQPQGGDMAAMLQAFTNQQQRSDERFAALLQTISANQNNNNNNSTTTTTDTTTVPPTTLTSANIPQFPKAPTIPNKLVDVVLLQVTKWMKNPALSVVSNWKISDGSAAAEVVSSYLISCLYNYDYVPEDYVDHFINHVKHNDDGFAVLDAYIKKLTPSKLKKSLDAVVQLSTLSMGDESTSAYMTRVDNISINLQQMSTNDIILYLAVNGLDKTRCGETYRKLLGNDPVLMTGGLEGLRGLLKTEEEVYTVLNSSPEEPVIPQMPSIQRAGAPPTADRPPPTTDGDRSTPQYVYPPSRAAQWQKIHKVIVDGARCPSCWTSGPRLPFCLQEGCPIAAACGLVCKKDETAAKAISDKYNAENPDKTITLEKVKTPPRSGNRNGNRQRRAAARRATSAEPQAPVPPPATQPTYASALATANRPASPAVNPNRYQTLQYPDIESDGSGDEGVFDDRSLDSNSNVDSAPYSLSSTPNLLHYFNSTLGTTSTTTKLLKQSRKYSSRREVRAQRASSARFLSAEVSNLSDTILHSDPSKIGFYNSNDEECCADTGATDVMLNDYKAFVSYKRVHNRYAMLGDDTKLKIEGVGTAVFRLNNYVVKIRNVLHIPALRGPLYSLRSHRMQPGCGTMSSYELGSYIWFPTFVLQVDDSTDNLISYRSLGRAYNGPMHYVQPTDASKPIRSASGRPMKTRSQSSMPLTVETESPDLVTPIISQESDEEQQDLSENNEESNNDTPLPASLPTIPADEEEDISVSPTPEDTTLPPSPSSSATENQPTSPTSIVDLTEDEMESNTSKPLSTSTLSKIHHDPTQLPSVPPSATPAPCEHRTEFDSLKLHRIFGHRRFKNQKHITDAANAKLLHTGALPATLGSFATITNPPHGKTITKHRRYLDKVHMDIVYGDCVSLGGYRYALILVDVATRYCWIYGMMSLTSAEVINALELFRADAEGMPKRFHADFDKKLIGGKALKWILTNESNIIAAPAKRQSSNGLAERTWRTIITMARAYITEKQVGRDMWYFAIRHSAFMLNQVPGRLGRKLTTPFELVHGVKPSSECWFELFSIGYFNHDTDNNESRSSSQAQTLDGIAVGRDDRSNTIIFYNPISKSYYRPPAYKLDESRLPITNFPKSIKFDGGLTCGLLRYRSQPIHEPFPPGTRVSIQQKDTLVRGTIQNVPLPFTPNVASAETLDSPLPEDQSTTYTIRLDDGTTITQGFEDLIAAGRDKDTPSVSSPQLHDVLEGIPSMLHPSQKVTMKHDGVYKKGYIGYSPEGGFTFVVRRNARSWKIDLSVPLPNFKQTWTTLMADDVIIPGHGTVSTLLQSPTSSSTPRVNFVSAKDLISTAAPPSLSKALHQSNPDRHVWSDSYNEEKEGLLDHDVYRSISKKEYLTLVRSGKISKAIPSMCVLVVKQDRDGKPHRAKSRIVVLGNFEDRIYEKSQRYAPVLKYDSLRLLTANAVQHRRILQQGDCKNAFCNATLPDDEATVIRPPVGDPAHERGEFWLLNKTLYGLRRSPHHWYNMVTTILKDMGLKASPHDPCLFSGIISNTTVSSDTTSTPAIPLPDERATIHIGLYVDDFVFFSASQQEEDLFKAVFTSKLQVDFMGAVDFFLGTAFTWSTHDDGEISVHLCQSAFTEYTAHRFSVDKMNPTPNMTPYRSGLPIDSIPQADLNDTDLKRRTKCYQQIVGSINWLSTCTRPDICPALTFLSSYNTAPHHQHYKAAIHALKYLYSTAEYGISFHSKSTQTLHGYNHFPNHHDKEAYTDATPPSPSECHEMTAFSDACWGGQFGNTVDDGTELELFKYRSLSGYLICMSGGPISWKGARQERTALSSCTAEIIATNECVKEVASIKHRAIDLGMLDPSTTTPVYNDNQACVQWSKSTTAKGIKHVSLRENYVREAQQDKEVDIKHIPGVINPSDIFTKEMRDATHFRRLRDCMMCSKSAFLKYHHNVPTEVVSSERILPYYSIRSETTPQE